MSDICTPTRAVDVGALELLQRQKEELYEKHLRMISMYENMLAQKEINLGLALDENRRLRQKLTEQGVAT